MPFVAVAFDFILSPEGVGTRAGRRDAVEALESDSYTQRVSGRAVLLPGACKARTIIWPRALVAVVRAQERDRRCVCSLHCDGVQQSAWCGLVYGREIKGAGENGSLPDTFFSVEKA